MISGTDIQIQSYPMKRSLALDTTVRCIFRHWSNAVVQDHLGHQIWFCYIPFYSIHELFVYKDRGAMICWNELGRHDLNYNEIIHVVEDEKMITLVVDNDQDPEMKVIVDYIKSILGYMVFSAEVDLTVAT